MKPSNKIMQQVESSPQDKTADMQLAKKFMKKKKKPAMGLGGALQSKGLV